MLSVLSFVSADKQLFAEVTWSQPLNLDYIPHKSVIYEVVAQADLFGDSGIIKTGSDQFKKLLPDDFGYCE